VFIAKVQNFFSYLLNFGNVVKSEGEEVKLQPTVFVPFSVT